jgi:hypothetical protein
MLLYPIQFQGGFPNEDMDNWIRAVKNTVWPTILNTFDQIGKDPTMLTRLEKYCLFHHGANGGIQYQWLLKVFTFQSINDDVRF